MRRLSVSTWLISTTLLAQQSQAPDPAEEVVTFKSDVALVRVDVQALSRDNRALNGLTASDFVIRDGGVIREVRNFAQENLPLDVLFLLDVSGSMRPHVERVAHSAQAAFQVLGREDRVGIMVFDRQTRVRMPFRAIREARYGFDDVLAREDFDGGTDITRGMLDAAQYVRRNARPEARRAVVILTDDRTEFDRDDDRVGRALAGADAVMSALIAPDALGRRGIPGGGYPGGGRRGGGGIGFPFPGGGGGNWPFPGGGGNGPVVMGNRTRSAGTAEIARDSGGDSYNVDDGEALENTMSRIRQRYALYFQVPPGVRAGEERRIEVALSGTAARRHAGAELRYRRSYTSGASTEGNATDVPPVEVSSSSPSPSQEPAPKFKRRPGVIDESRSTRGPAADPEAGGWKRVDPADAAKPTAEPPKPATAEPATGGGWRRVKPGEQN